MIYSVIALQSFIFKQYFNLLYSKKQDVLDPNQQWDDILHLMHVEVYRSCCIHYGNYINYPCSATVNDEEIWSSFYIVNYLPTHQLMNVLQRIQIGCLKYACLILNGPNRKYAKALLLQRASNKNCEKRFDAIHDTVLHFLNEKLQHDKNNKYYGPCRDLIWRKEPDGRLNTHYILPGDYTQLIIRVGTFFTYPQHMWLDPRFLAHNGFCYTGIGHCVKCYSCKFHCDGPVCNDRHTCADWHTSCCRANDEADEILLHVDVDLVKSYPCKYPEHSGYQTEESRHESFQLNSSVRNQHQLNSLVAAGFIWKGIVNLTYFGSSGVKLARICANVSRVYSNSHHQGTRHEKTTAGRNNLILCWYCGGPLMNFESCCEPWKEHATLFPTCDFVLQKRGPRFVHLALSETTSRPYKFSHRSGRKTWNLVFALVKFIRRAALASSSRTEQEWRPLHLWRKAFVAITFVYRASHPQN